MKTKALLTNTNTVWGVILNPQSSDVYRHILSFENQTVKDQFITKNLTGGEDYKVVLDRQPAISLTQISAQTATFRVNISDYPNESVNSLLNKDFAMIRENGEIKFYTLSATRLNVNVIAYNCSLDIFFTHNIKNMFNDNKTKISQAHFDRVLNGPNPPFIGEWAIPNEDQTLNSPMYSVENFPDLPKSVLIPSKTTPIFPKLQIQIDIDVVDPDGHSSPEDLEWFRTEYKKEIMKQTFLNFLVSSNDAGSYNPFPESSSSNFASYNVYDVFLFPGNDPSFTNTDFPSKSRFKWSSNSITYNDIRFVEPEFVYKYAKPSDPRTYKTGGFSISPFSIFHILKQSSQILKLEIQYFSNSISTTLKLPVNSLNSDVFFPITDPAKNHVAVYMNRPFEIELENLPVSFLPKPLYVNEFGLKLPIKRNLGKINSSQFKKFFIDTQTSLEKRIYQENLTSTKANYKAGISPENFHYSITLLDYFKNISNDVDTTNEKSLFEFYANYAFPTSQIPYEEYISRNKSQLNNSLLSKGLSTGAAVIGGGAAIATGGLGAAFGALTVAAKSVFDITQTLSQQKDLKNSPKTIISNGVALQNDLADGKRMYPMLSEYEFPKHLKSSIEDHLYLYGYNYENRLYNINNLLDTRYYFNFIEAPETFENINLQLSSDIKQIINDTLEKGVFIWHVRDVDTFEGVKNYEYDNLEMGIFNATKK